MAWEVRVYMKDPNQEILLGKYDAKGKAELAAEGIFKKSYFRIERSTESFSYYPTNMVTMVELVKVK